jgi:hypothetical protein
MKGGTGGAQVECPPEPARSMAENLEIIVEGQLGRVTRAYDTRLSQPQPMFDVLDPKRTYQPSEACRTSPAGISARLHIAAGCGSTPNNRNDCRQNFRRPEDSLILRRSRRVSHKSKGPISFRIL